jgi:FtsP/CotA-like multicopper oxidase with cupredoxin domain
MARVREYWLQLENHPWDTCPWGIDRLAGRSFNSQPGGAFRPVPQEVLALRRYTFNWGQPVAEPVNPWDLTEPDPARGPSTLPGAVLEAKVADEIVVHFRNMDQRAGLSDVERRHSLHPHGAQRAAVHDGTFPLSPADPVQGNRHGDRVVPGDSFTYRWTCPQRAAAGAWLVHDASVAGIKGTGLGAFAVLIIRAPGEQEPDRPATPVRQPQDTALRFAAVPQPPKRGEYILVFHELPGVGLCINGRQLLGNTPTLVAGAGTQMAVRCLNATLGPVSVHVHGFRWEHGGSWVDTEILPSGGGASLSLLAGSAEQGGALGEWLVVGRSSTASVAGTILVTGGGPVALDSG